MRDHLFTYMLKLRTSGANDYPENGDSTETDVTLKGMAADMM